MEIVSQTQARRNFFDLVKRVNKEHLPIIATNKDTLDDVVIMGKRDYESLLETLYLYGIPGMKEKIAKAEKEEEIPFTSLEDIPDV